EGGADHHEEAESKVVGILQKTGTPIDRAIYIPILAYYLMAGHGDDESGEFNGTRDSRGISAIMMSTKAGYYRQQIYRSINNRLDAMAVFPSVEMRKLFSIIGSGDLVLRIISLLVIVVALAGVLVAIYNSMGARRKEFAVLRALGASRSTIITIVTFESSVIAAVGAVIGLSFAFVFLVALSSHVHEFSGVKLHATIGIEHLKIVAAVIAAGGLAGLVPALEAYRTDAATQLSSNA
ncbi:MAG: FtsX-like permease family protein, partial [Planctomycetota bacterium]|nr:FtsX-like permease family protein [Planctomycetota bacterium]